MVPRTSTFVTAAATVGSVVILQGCKKNKPNPDPTPQQNATSQFLFYEEWAKLATDATPFCKSSFSNNTVNGTICAGGPGADFGGGNCAPCDEDGACDCAVSDDPSTNSTDTYKFDQYGNWTINMDPKSGKGVECDWDTQPDWCANGPFRFFSYLDGVKNPRSDQDDTMTILGNIFSFDVTLPKTDMFYTKLLFWGDGGNFNATDLPADAKQNYDGKNKTFVMGYDDTGYYNYLGVGPNADDDTKLKLYVLPKPSAGGDLGVPLNSTLSVAILDVEVDKKYTVMVQFADPTQNVNKTVSVRVFDEAGKPVSAEDADGNSVSTFSDDKKIPVDDTGKIAPALNMWTKDTDVELWNNNCWNGLQYGLYTWPDHDQKTATSHTNATETFTFGKTCIGCYTADDFTSGLNSTDTK